MTQTVKVIDKQLKLLAYMSGQMLCLPPFTVHVSLVFLAFCSICTNQSITWTQVDSRDWALNGNTISLDEDTVIDVPQPFDQMERYCASLGHKANHSFTPNCKYDP